MGSQGSDYATAGNHLDLDPTYKDRLGRPLLRMTIDFPDNEIKMSAFLTDRYAEIIKAMGAREVLKRNRARGHTISPSTRPRICAAA